MLKKLIMGILSALAVKLLDNYRHLSVQLLKIEATKAYLLGVRMARFSALSLMGLGLLIGLIFVGALLVHTGLFILLPWSVEAKAILGICLGLAYIAIGGIALRVAFDEKTWIIKSGADKMLKDATGQSDKD
jgi:hypothetical protein